MPSGKRKSFKSALAFTDKLREMAPDLPPEISACLPRQALRGPNPDKPVQAVLLLAVTTTVTGLLNWALCFVMSALLIPFVARRNPKAPCNPKAPRLHRAGRPCHGAMQTRGPIDAALQGRDQRMQWAGK